MAEELSFEELFEKTSAEVVKAAAEEDLVPSGNYITKASIIKKVRIDEDADYNAGRELAYLRLTFFEEDGKTRVGETMATVSWEPRYYQTQRGPRLDKAARLYNALIKAVTPENTSPGAVLQAAERTAFMSKVRENYVVSNDDLYEEHEDMARDDGRDVWVTLDAEDEEAREHYLSLGFEPRTQVDRFWRIK